MSYFIHNQRSLEFKRTFSLPKQFQDSKKQKVHFFSSGREALVTLIKCLKISQNRVVLLPGVVPEGLYAPFTQAGWRIILYKVDRNLNPVWDHLETLLQENKPQIAILIHYFGLPKPIKKFVDICHIYNTLVVEDMAHAYLGETENGPLGQNGDFILYSLPKMIGIPEGAPLVVRNSSVVKVFPKLFKPKLHYLYIAQQMINLILTTILPNIPTKTGKAVVSLFSRRLAGSGYKTLMQYFTTPTLMFRLSYFLLCHIDHKEVQLQRQRLAQVYIKKLDRSKFKFFSDAERSLNVMMGFPVLLPDRDAFVQYLAQHSISGVHFVNRWYFIPKGEEKIYSEAISVLDTHFLFPLNQHLSLKQINYVIKIANNWSIKH